MNEYQRSILLLEQMQPECEAQREAIRTAIEALEKIIVLKDFYNKVFE